VLARGVTPVTPPAEGGTLANKSSYA